MQETGILFDIKRFAVHDGPGIRTTVFFKGCPLRCAWCHNPEGIAREPELSFTRQKCALCGACVAACPQGAHRIDAAGHTIDRSRCTRCGKCVEACYPRALTLYGRAVTVEELLTEVLADRAFYDESGGGVTASGGEPLLQSDFCAALFAACRAEGVHTALDTCGAVPWEAFARVLPHTSLVLYDLKHTDSAAHRRWTGLGNERTLENLLAVGRSGVPVEVRVPCVPTVNDEMIGDMARFLTRVATLTGVRLLPYHDFARSKYAAIGLADTMPHVEKPSPERMEELRAIVRRQGLNVME